jgi:hypothetical protein
MSRAALLTYAGLEPTHPTKVVGTPADLAEVGRLMSAGDPIAEEYLGS